MSRYTAERRETFTRYQNENGARISVAACPVLERDGYIFKDPAGCGVLEAWCDWRLSPEERAADLARRLSVEEIAGLMIYSAHQMVPAPPAGPFPGFYGGKPFSESGAQPWDLTVGQKRMLTEDHIRHVLLSVVSSPAVSARWNNRLQALAESLPHAIPVNISSDPRHGAGKAAVEFKSEAAAVSKWPEGLGMAATFDDDLCRDFGAAVAKEYRALGIATALGPQIDVGTDPRWMRFEDTFGPSPELVTRLGKLYCDALQTTEGTATGWGRDSVLAMVKHWPGGGPCEAGRDAHYPYGKFAVYPGGCQAEHLKPFTEGAFKLDGPTKCAAAVMPYYTISCDFDEKTGRELGNSYNHHLISDLLRDKYGYEGVVCTDWGITGDPAPQIDSFGSRCYGTESLTEAERHLKIIENGVDQFGGNTDIRPVLEAYRLGCEKHGEAAMRRRFEQSAVRLLLGSFRCGLFDDPYLDPAESEAIVGCREFTDRGFEAQLKSLVLLKNKGVLPLKDKIKVYVPDRHIGPGKTFFRTPAPAADLPGADRRIVERFFDWAQTPEEADAAIIFIESPISDGYDAEKGYLPISLQYRPYTAATARETSLAGGDFREPDPNRSYRGRTGVCRNEGDLDLVCDARKVMGDKPVIVVIRMHHGAVLGELEPFADAIVADFGVQTEAVLTLLTGGCAPAGRLPLQLPKDMETVEAHCEDRPLDLEPYTDGCSNRYDFGFGLSWSGTLPPV